MKANRVLLLQARNPLFLNHLKKENNGEGDDSTFNDAMIPIEQLLAHKVKLPINPFNMDFIRPPVSLHPPPIVL